MATATAARQTTAVFCEAARSLPQMMAMMASSARSLPYAAARARPVHLLAHSSVSSRGLRQAAAGGPPLAAAQALPLPHRSFASEAAATPEARIKEILEERFPVRPPSALRSVWRGDDMPPIWCRMESSTSRTPRVAVGRFTPSK